MTGMERNSDVVQLAAYAPLFVHAEDHRCPTNLIVFDNHRLVFQSQGGGKGGGGDATCWLNPRCEDVSNLQHPFKNCSYALSANGE